MSLSNWPQCWDFARATRLLNLVTIVVGFFAAAIVLSPYASIMGWFGFIYLMALTIALVVLLLVPARSLDTMTRLSSLQWFAVSGFLAVMLTILYAAFSAPSSGTPNDTIIVIQLFHSGIFFGLSMLVAVLWQLWRTLRAKAVARAVARAAVPT